MKAFFKIQQETLVPCSDADANITVYSTPEEAEKQEIVNVLDLPRHDVESALDPDEISRVDFTPDYIYIIWKRPNNVSFEQQLRFEVSSVGLVIQKNKLTLISGASGIPLESNEFRKLPSFNSVILKFFLQTVHHYFGHLKGIKMLTAELQAKLNVSMENRYLLQMFALSESLIYYLNALEGNATVLNKLRANAEKMGFSSDEIEMLDDVIIEHQQCNRQMEIYSSVLSGLMDARGSIINNNVNALLRNLTIINVVFLPLNLIASIGGMSEYSQFTKDFHWTVSYGFLAIALIILGWVTWYLLIKHINREASLPKRH